MNFPSQLSEERTNIPGSSRVLPEQTIFASCLALLALAAFLAQRYDESLLLALYGETDVRTAQVWRAISLLGSRVFLAPLVAAGTDGSEKKSVKLLQDFAMNFL